jgi:hypothetical protein
MVFDPYAFLSSRAICGQVCGKAVRNRVDAFSCECILAFIGEERVIVSDTHV